MAHNSARIDAVSELSTISPYQLGVGLLIRVCFRWVRALGVVSLSNTLSTRVLRLDPRCLQVRWGQ